MNFLKSLRTLGLAILCLALTHNFVHAQPNTNPPAPAEVISAHEVATMLGSTNLIDAFKGILRDPDTLNAIAYGLTHKLLETEQTNAVLGLLKDLNLRPKVFHTQNAADNAVLGLEYNFQKSIANRTLMESSLHPMGLSLTLDARGDIAAEASKNPNNFLESGGTLHLFQGLGGINPSFKRDAKFFAALDNAQTEAGNIPPSPNWRSDPRWERSARMVSTNLVPQFFWDLAAHGTLESDQRFSQRQYSYGGKLSLVFRDWADQSLATKLNLLDYPFAAIRWLTETDKTFQPSGRAFPVFVGGIDAVDPSSFDNRLAIDPDTDAYPRARLELHFRTRVVRWANEDLWFSANYRFFQELGASDLIEAVGLDRQEYFVVKVDLPLHFNLSYSTGKLPLDQQRDHVYALGWSLTY